MTRPEIRMAKMAGYRAALASGVNDELTVVLNALSIAAGDKNVQKDAYLRGTIQDAYAAAARIAYRAHGAERYINSLGVSGPVCKVGKDEPRG